MKVTSPKDKANDLAKLQEAIDKFEAEFAQEEGGESYYHIVIWGEYNRAVCNEVERLYAEAGWLLVQCKTSSENGERGGLTGLELRS